MAVSSQTNMNLFEGQKTPGALGVSGNGVYRVLSAVCSLLLMLAQHLILHKCLLFFFF